MGSVNGRDGCCTINDHHHTSAEMCTCAKTGNPWKGLGRSASFRQQEKKRDQALNLERWVNDGARAARLARGFGWQVDEVGFSWWGVGVAGVWWLVGWWGEE